MATASLNNREPLWSPPRPHDSCCRCWLFKSGSFRPLDVFPSMIDHTHIAIEPFIIVSRIITTLLSTIPLTSPWTGCRPRPPWPNNNDFVEQAFLCWTMRCGVLVGVDSVLATTRLIDASIVDPSEPERQRDKSDPSTRQKRTTMPDHHHPHNGAVAVYDESFEPPSSSGNGGDEDDGSLVNNPPALFRRSRRRGQPQHDAKEKSTLLVVFLLYLCGCAMVGIAIGFIVAYCGMAGRCSS
jgi:hypothetical protein